MAGRPLTESRRVAPGLAEEGGPTFGTGPWPGLDLDREALPGHLLTARVALVRAAS